MFRNTGANAFAKNQTRLAYEDKRDLYCRDTFSGILRCPSKIGFTVFIACVMCISENSDIVLNKLSSCLSLHYKPSQPITHKVLGD